MTRYIAFDFETTGFDDGAVPKNHPTQFAAVAYSPSTDSYEDIINSAIVGGTCLGRWSKAQGHKLPESGSTLDEALEFFLGSLQSTDILVAHNLEYDWDKVINTYASPDHIRALSTYQKRCSMKGTLGGSRQRDKWLKLEELCKKLQVPYDELAAHDALYDSKVLSQCIASGLRRNITP
jgi:DNA polymerase III epsilon subunit-like protein